MHLFILIARSDYFHGLVGSPMQEARNMESALLDAPEGLSRSGQIYQMFIRYLYFDELTQVPDKLTVQEILFLCELSEFYGLRGADRLKNLAEGQIRN